MRHVLFLLLLVTGLRAGAQNEVAEWRKKLAMATADTERTALLMHLGFYFAGEQPDSAAMFYHRAALIAKKSGDEAAFAKAGLAESEVLLSQGFTIQAGKIILEMDTLVLDNQERLRWHRCSELLHVLRGDIRERNKHKASGLQLLKSADVPREWLYDVLELGLFTGDSILRTHVLESVRSWMTSTGELSLLKAIEQSLRQRKDTIHFLLEDSWSPWKTARDSMSMSTAFFLKLNADNNFKKSKKMPMWLDSIMTWLPTNDRIEMYPLIAFHFTQQKSTSDAARWWVKTDSLMVQPAEQLEWYYLKAAMQGALGLKEAQQETMNALDTLRSKLWLLESTRLLESLESLEHQSVLEVKAVKQEAAKSTEKYKGWLYVAAFCAALLLGAALWLTIRGVSHRRKWAAEKTGLNEELLALKSSVEDNEDKIKRKEQEVKKTDNETAKLRTLVEQQEMELRRAGMEVSDQVGSAIVIARQHLDLLRQSGKDLSVEQFMLVQNALTKANKELKRLSDLLVPENLEQKGLTEALRLLAEKQSRQGLQITVTPAGKPFMMDHIQEIALYRIGAEIITNTIKHAQASRLNIQLNFLDRELVLIASDNGCGFDVNAAVSQGKGVKGIVSRVTLLKGSIDVASSAASGTEYTISVKSSK